VSTTINLERVCEKHGPYTARQAIGRVFAYCPACGAEAAAAEEARRNAEQEAAKRDAWLRRLGFSGIPERFQDRRLSNYIAATPEQKSVLDFARAYVDDFEQVRKTGRSAIFLGMPGTGKTHIACAVAMAAMHKHNASALFVTVARAVRLVKDSWSKDSDRSESEAIELLTAPDLLILDEVGIQSGSDFEKNLIFDVLNERYARRRPVILLSNLEPKEISAFLGERVMDRLREDGATVHAFTWSSHRGVSA
jgi:DNA replication protein DnaC